MIPDDGTRRRSPCPPVVAPSTTTTKLLPAASPRCYQRLNSLSRTPSQQHPRRCTYRNALQQPWPLNTSNDDDEDLIRPARSTTPYSENNKTKSQSTQQGGKKNNKKNSPKQKPRNSKEPKTPTNPLNHDTPLVVKRIKSPPPQNKPSSTRPHSLYKQKIKIKTKKSLPKTKTKSEPKLISTTTQNNFSFAKPRMETRSWKMNLSKCNQPKKNKQTNKQGCYSLAL
jgi:hypothetical protein